jgi:MYXO-CTERM domain-containing protein
VSFKKKFKLSGFCAALAVLAQTAAAAPVVLDASMAAGTLLGGGSHAGTFDGSAVLPTVFQIDAASFSFTFRDDSDALVGGPQNYVGSTYSAYSLISSGYNGSNYYYNYLRQQHNGYAQTKTTEGESASVSLGSGALSAGSGSTATTSSAAPASTQYTGQSYDTSSGYNGYSYTYGCGNHSTCSGYNPGSWSYYYSDNYSDLTVTTIDQTGSFTVSGTVTDDALLAELMADRSLAFSLGVQGDLVLTGGWLSLDVTELPTAAAEAIPEPASGALALAALGAAAYATRRRRKDVG